MNNVAMGAVLVGLGLILMQSNVYMKKNNMNGAEFRAFLRKQLNIEGMTVLIHIGTLMAVTSLLSLMICNHLFDMITFQTVLGTSLVTPLVKGIIGRVLTNAK